MEPQQHRRGDGESDREEEYSTTGPGENRSACQRSDVVQDVGRHPRDGTPPGGEHLPNPGTARTKPLAHATVGFSEGDPGIGEGHDGLTVAEPAAVRSTVRASALFAMSPQSSSNGMNISAK